MRTLNDIIPPSRRSKDVEPLNTSKSNPQERPQFPYKTLFIVLVIILLSIGALFYFSSAKIEVIPATVSVATQGSFTATQSSGTLPYEIITTQKIASQSVKSNGTKTANTYASGTITVYNTQSKAQTLRATTRFATSAGLIFRIRAAITVPSGTTTKPGSITTQIYADKTGAEYNVGPTSFTLPGFAGTPQESMVYARSTNAMTDGASGSIPIVETALEDTTKKALMKALEPDLITSIQEKVPSGYVLLTGASATTYEELTPTASVATGQVEIKIQGTMTAVVFPNSAFAKTIATSASNLGYQGEPISLSSSNTLVLTPETNLPNPDQTSFSFTLSGTASLMYVIDPIRIATAVSGKTREASRVAVSNFPEVKRAIIMLKPFWRQTFPQDPASISVVVRESTY